MTDYTESIEFSEKDEADLAKLLSDPPEAPSYHPLLQVWRDVLAPAAAEAKKKVTPQWASKMVQSYPGLAFADIVDLRDAYFGKLDQMLDVLKFEIASDSDCLTYSTPEEDAVENAAHYKNVLLTWQLLFLQYELDWYCTDEYAAVELAAISEVHKTLFGGADRPGLVAFLDNIKFEYTEADQQQLADALEELRGSGE